MLDLVLDHYDSSSASFGSATLRLNVGDVYISGFCCCCHPHLLEDRNLTSLRRIYTDLRRAQGRLLGTGGYWGGGERRQ